MVTIIGGDKFCWHCQGITPSKLIKDGRFVCMYCENTYPDPHDHSDVRNYIDARKPTEESDG